MFFKKKTKMQSNKRSQILSVQFTTLDIYEYLTGRDCLKCEIVVDGADNKIYRIIAKTTEFGLLEVNVFDATNKKLSNVEAFGNICEENGINYFFLDRIGNGKYNKMGFGHLMMQAVIYVLAEYEKLYNIEFSYIKGTLGIYGNDSHEDSIPFYKTFNNFKFNETKHMYLKEELLNERNRRVLYLIA